MIYLDHNSTTPIAAEVADAIAQCHAEGYVNPSSQHGPGRIARRKLETARDGIAEILGAKTTGMDADSIIFTSGGTEANNLALFGLTGDANANSPGSIAISSIEHPSIADAAKEMARRGWNVEWLRVSREGVIDVAHVEELLAAAPETARPALLSAMLGNNETGVLQPVREIAALCRQAGVPVHTDAVQVVGKLPLGFRDLGVDAMTVSAHKFHGPRGIGVLALRHGVELQPLLHGGFQQAGLRPGTEDVALAVGMWTALQLWQREAESRRERMQRLRAAFERKLVDGEPAIVINGAHANRLPHTSNVSFPGVDRQAMLMALDLAGVACSTGSACASGSSEPSPVLVAMGCDGDVISSALRFSLGDGTTDSDIEEGTRRILLAYNNLQHGKKPSFAARTPRGSA